MSTHWSTRVDGLWDTLKTLPADDFVASMRALVAERGDSDPEAPFHLGSAFDSTGATAPSAAHAEVPRLAWRLWPRTV